MLDLGRVVASAEVRVNGQVAGIRVAPPWTVDITKLVKPGENRIEILVYNTLANHYVTIPTRYRGDLTSGLLGPATLIVKRPAPGNPASVATRATGPRRSPAGRSHHVPGPRPTP